MSIAATAAAAIRPGNRSRGFLMFRVKCSDSKPSRGFGSKKPTNNNKTSKATASSREDKDILLQQRKSKAKQSGSLSTPAPGLSSRLGAKSKSNATEFEFEERLAAVRRSALEQKKLDKMKELGPIDYDAPVEPENTTIRLGTKVGVGVAVLVFGLVFAPGDFLPSGSDSPPQESAVTTKRLSEEEKVTLQTRLKQYEATLSISNKDAVALEGAAVTSAELGDYTKAASLLQDLAKEKPNDPDVFRLLGEVKYELKDYEGSVAAYRSSTMVSKDVNFEVLRGLTNALLAANKPDEAVQVLLASHERLNSESSSGFAVKGDGNAPETESQKVDPIQIDLLLGKAYSDWGHVSDAIAVYDQLISSHPDDFRGYLAKGIILKENGNVGDAERMFIQARFYAPKKAKGFVDRYSRT